MANNIAYKYIETYKDIAIAEMKRTGIPASIKLAQGMIESDMGRSPLALEANNHFGIKCGKDWQGTTYYKHDDDKDSTGTIIESCFRAYAIAEESFKAHSTFLTSPGKRSRYGFLFSLPSTDYEGWANGLKMAGYATDPSYPSKLTKVINLYKLHQYDEEIIRVAPVESQWVEEVIKSNKKDENPKKEHANKSNPIPSNQLETYTHTASASTKVVSKYFVEKVNGTKFVTCKGGENLQTIAKTQNLDVFDLLYYNEGISSPYTVLYNGHRIFLEPKKKKFDQEWHKTTKDESLFDISQNYGIKLSVLAYKNNVHEDAIIQAGQRVSLDKHLSKRETPKHTLQERFDRFIELGDTK
jgi:hypothetical protein